MPLLREDFEDFLLMPLASRECKDHWLAAPFRPQMNFGAKPAPATAQSLVLLPPFCSSRILMGPNNRGIHIVLIPIEMAFCIRLMLQGLQEALPYSGSSPAIEAAGKGLPGTIV